MYMILEENLDIIKHNKKQKGNNNVTTQGNQPKIFL